MIAVATSKGISIWHVGSNPESDGRLFVERVALLSGHNGEVPFATSFALLMSFSCNIRIH